MLTYYSHAKSLSEDKKLGSKLLSVHTFGVRDNAFARFHSGLHFLILNPFEIKTLLDHICRLHDLGKYTTYFQDYLLGRPFDQIMKQHARLGAITILNLYPNQVVAYLAYFIIKNHHRSLHTPDDVNADRLICSNGYPEVAEIFHAQLDTLTQSLDQIETELQLPNLQDYFTFPTRKPLARFIKDWLRDEADIAHYFLINYLFSLLIEGDKLDASDTKLYQRKGTSIHAVNNYLHSLNPINSPQNQLRNQVRHEVVSILDRPENLQYRLFLLTAPTGIGKTLTALDFALRLRDRLPHQPQIIVGLPFINIIEQTLAEYEKVLGHTKAEILGHYQYADIFGPQSENNTDEEKQYHTRRMELDTWQADIVVTSFVQLLQTMINNRNKILLKFNHLAGAIVIMDEVQSLRLEQVPLIGAVLYCMSKFLDTRFVLMTATKPLIFELADQYILEPFLQEKSEDQCLPLLARPEIVFRAFHRTQIIPLLTVPLEDTSAFVDLFLTHWQVDKSSLIVCNTVNRSIEVFDMLSELVPATTPIFYLSTNVLPLFRLETIQNIKRRLKAGEKVILVATQVVEAGVDLDFDMGFRDLGPIDSIVQVAGRINRENDEARQYSPLYIVDTGDCERIYCNITATQAKKALGEKPILEPDYFELVEQYFKKVADRGAYDESIKFFRGMQHLQYTSSVMPNTSPISDFKVIKESPNILSVFVEIDKTEDPGVAEQCRTAFIAMLQAPSRQEKFALKEEFNKKHKRNFHERILAIPEYYCSELPLIDETKPQINIRWVPATDLPYWYNSPTGFNRQQNKMLIDNDKVVML